MSLEKKACKVTGCGKTAKSLGRRYGKKLGTYYSNYCNFHRKAYNRPKC